MRQRIFRMLEMCWFRYTPLIRWCPEFGTNRQKRAPARSIEFDGVRTVFRVRTEMALVQGKLNTRPFRF